MEWLQCVEVGGKGAHTVLENSQLQVVSLYWYSHFGGACCKTVKRLCQTLKATAETVNLARTSKGFPHFKFSFNLFVFNNASPAASMFCVC